jgi:Tfp pilus assembly protein PilF
LAHCNLGNVLKLRGELAEAAACYRRAIALQPGMVLAHRNLGAVLCESGHLAVSFASFRRHAELAYGTLASPARGGEPIPAHQARHDREQQDYLNAHNAAPAA